MAEGAWVTPLLLCFIDHHARLVCHLQWYLDETAEVLVHGMCQILQKSGLPRALMADNGAAMKPEELISGLHALGILHETTLPYSTYQNVRQETFWATVEDQLMAMLEGVAELTLERSTPSPRPGWNNTMLPSYYGISGRRTDLNRIRSRIFNDKLATF